MIELFLRVLNMSITAAWIIPVVLLIRFLLKKAPKKYSYALWSVVAFRLVCPVSFESVFSLFSLRFFDMSAAQQTNDALTYIPPDIGMMTQPQVTVGVPAVNAVINNSLPAAVETASANPMQILLFAGMCLWCIGMAAMLIYAVVSYIRLRLRLRTATLLEENIFQSERVSSPFILGFFCPKIYIPYGLDDGTLHHVLTHERCHIRHLDHFVKPLAFLILTVHWFNPLVWLSFVLMGKDMEMRCDEKVLSTEENIRRAYSTSLLHFATAGRFPSPGPLAFGETGVKTRIQNALNWKKPALWITVAAVLVCTAAVVFLAADPARRTLDLDDREIISANSTDLRLNSGPLTRDMNAAQIDELASRVDGLKGEKSDEYGGFTPFYQITAQLSDGSWLRISGYSATKDMVCVELDGVSYVITDEDFCDYLDRFCAGGDGAAVEALAVWTHMPAASASFWHWFRFEFGMDYTYIAAECTAGELEDADAPYGGTRAPTGSRIRLSEGRALYWSPYAATLDGYTYVEDAEISFEVYNGSALVAEGKLLITFEPTADAGLGRNYYARLVDAGNYSLRQGEWGGIIAAGGYEQSFSFADLQPGESVTYPGEIVLTNAENTFSYQMTYGRTGLEAEVTLLRYDGSAYHTDSFEGGSRSASIEGIPAGVYYLHVRNSLNNLEHEDTSTEPLTMTGAISFSHTALDSVAPTATADLDRDGEAELITVMQTGNYDYILTVQEADGELLWSQQASSAHGGWVGIFLCETEEGHCLLRYLPTMYQSVGTYSYELFTLEDGVLIRASDAIEFDLNERRSVTSEMAFFSDSLNKYLQNSVVLLSTLGGDLSLGNLDGSYFLEDFSELRPEGNWGALDAAIDNAAYDYARGVLDLTGKDWSYHVETLYTRATGAVGGDKARMVTAYSLVTYTENGADMTIPMCISFTEHEAEIYELFNCTVPKTDDEVREIFPEITWNEILKS